MDSKFRLLLTAVVFGIFYTPLGRAAATEVSVTTGRDTTIFANATNNSDGSGVEMLTGNTGIAAPNTQPRRALMWFDIADAVPQGAIIESVSLSLHLSSASTMGPANVSLSLYRLLDSWGEGASVNGTGSATGAGVAAQSNDATWDARFFNTGNPGLSTMWTTPGGDFFSTPSATLSVSKLGADPYTTDFKTWQSAAMAADVQLWLDDPAQNFGWTLSLSPTDTTVNTERRFNTREAAPLPADLTHASTPVIPELTITYLMPAGVPEPDTVVLSVTAVMGLLGMVTHRRYCRKTRRSRTLSQAGFLKQR